MIAGPRRTSIVASFVTLAAGTFALTYGCALQPTSQTGSSSSASSTQDGGVVDAGIYGAGCGVDDGTGAVLCTAVSTCPHTFVDTQATPHCGFRIRGSIAELVCGCGNSICSMGSFTTCDQAQRLLNTQTEQGVCVQVADQRCEVSTSRGSSSSSSSSNGNGTGTTTGTGKPAPKCDPQCMSECGGGAACASICECQ